MCSAWTSSVPSGVNSAAEQSARSLMFGLYAARRSTAPISSATPVSREISTWSAAGSIHARARAPTSRARAAPRPSPRGSTWCSRASATTAGPRDRARSTAGRSVDSQRRGGGRARPHRDDLDRRSGPRVTVAPLVLGREVVRRRHRDLVALPDVAAVDRGLDRRVGRPRARARRAATSARAASSAVRVAAPTVCTTSCRRGEHSKPTAEPTPARGGTITAAHAERVGDRARVQRPAPPNATARARRGSTPRSTVTARTACSIAASTTATHSGGVHTGAFAARRAPRRHRAGRDRET